MFCAYTSLNQVYSLLFYFLLFTFIFSDIDIPNILLFQKWHK